MHVGFAIVEKVEKHMFSPNFLLCKKICKGINLLINWFLKRKLWHTHALELRLSAESVYVSFAYFSYSGFLLTTFELKIIQSTSFPTANTTKIQTGDRQMQNYRRQRKYSKI